jgi:trk system potassium uptake protein TrkH
MSFRHVANVVGLLLVFVALAMGASGVVGLLYPEGGAVPLFTGAMVTGVVGLVAYGTTRFQGDLTHREGFVIVTCAWAGTALFGGIPYLVSGVTPTAGAAFFESMSGFTTTGATVFTDIESLPRGILFWRSLTHWLGGMGIIVLVIAVLPFLGVGGMQLFRAEVPGPTPERLRPRITQTAKLLWLVYVGLTAAQAILYLLGGMSLFEAVTHGFATLATGGFSTRNASLAAYDSAYIQWVTVLFMYLAGINFALHFRAAGGRFEYFRDHEWRFFTLLIVGATGAVTAVNLSAGSYDLGLAGIETAARDAAFQVTAITTTTGFITDDYEVWAPAGQMLIFALFFVGGMAGSTGGGVKVVRVLLLLKQTGMELRKHLHPRAVLLARVGRQVVKEDVMANVVGFVILYLLLFLAGAVALSFLGLDLLTAVGASAATIGNIGPGLGDVGPTDNYGWMSDPALLVLSFLMLAGRLEIYTVLLLLHPETWKRRRDYH